MHLYLLKEVQQVLNPLHLDPLLFSVLMKVELKGVMVHSIC